MDFFNQLLERHHDFKEKSLTSRLISHKDLVRLVNKHKVGGLVHVELLGDSVKGRSIYHLSLGSGPTTVLMWTQMHGNEPTATAAVMDVLNFIRSQPEAFQDALQKIFKELTIHIVPMLNPDGAEQFERHNAIGVDMNRDALNLTSPESQMLKALNDRLQPDWAFNLHDQKREHGVSTTAKPATLSFLAPQPYPEPVGPENQKRAMQLIAHWYELMGQTELIDQVGRYDDEHTATAFGDNFQKWGASTILLESGADYKDRERQTARKYNFALLVDALHTIAQESYTTPDINVYHSIPLNKRMMCDVLFRDITVHIGNRSFQVDLAVDLLDKVTAGSFFYEPYINSIGDSRLSGAYISIDAQNYEVVSDHPLEPEQSMFFRVVDKKSEQTVYDFSRPLKDPYLKA